MKKVDSVDVLNPEILRITDPDECRVDYTIDLHYEGEPSHYAVRSKFRVRVSHAIGESISEIEDRSKQQLISDLQSILDNLSSDQG